MKRNAGKVLLVAALGIGLLALTPMIATLELHHELGDADQDGHQHSPHDLCSWVQSHASSSVTACVVSLVSQPAAPAPETPYRDRLVQHFPLTDLPTRGPPPFFSL